VDTTCLRIAPYEIDNRSEIPDRSDSLRRLVRVEEVRPDQLHSFDALEPLALGLHDPRGADRVAALHELLHYRRAKRARTSRYQHFCRHAGKT
jgi:hypothetical protein